MNHEFKSLKVTEILLDQNNPRFPAVQNQKEAINAMIDDQGEKLVNLAKDICESGLDPSKRMIVFREKGKLIDGDGNRRLIALKLLETPSLADSNQTIKKKFETLKSEYKAFPTFVDCVILDSRVESRHWIEINHSGDLGGRGQVSWNPEQKDRFEGSPSIGLSAMDLLQKRGLISEDDKQKVYKSTFDRVLGYRTTKDALSINSTGGNYRFGDVDRLKKLFDAMKGLKVESVYRADISQAFVKNVIGDLAPRDTTPENSAQVNKTPDTQAPFSTPHSRTKRSTQKLLVPFGRPLSLKPGIVNNLYRDIERLYKFYQDEMQQQSKHFIVLFRMPLRLLAETAAHDMATTIEEYLKNQFDDAKKTLDANAKTTLAAQNVNKNTIVQLFQTGAHNYTNCLNEEQAIAMSIILGAMLTKSHGKK
jgi:hypothetical protein